MAHPVANGVTSLSGTSIPTLIGQNAIMRFFERTVYKEIATTDIVKPVEKMGEAITLVNEANPTVRNYAIGQDLITTREDLSSVTLYVNKGKYYSIPVDKVEKIQSAYDLMKLGDSGAKALSVAVDQDVLQNIYSDSHASNKGATAGAKTSIYNMGVTGTPRLVTKDNADEVLAECAAVLGEQNCPPEDWWMIIPPWFSMQLKTSALKDASVTGEGSMLLKGFVGKIAGFKIFESNNLYMPTDVGAGGYVCTNVLFGQKNALAFASQMDFSRTVQDSKILGDIMQQCMIYGYKVIKPEAMGTLYCRKG